MPTIVIHKKSKQEFVLLGTGFGSYRTHRPHGILADVYRAESGEFPMMCICDRNGKIGWVRTNAMKVKTIDGEEPHEVLGVKKSKPKAKRVPKIPKTN